MSAPITATGAEAVVVTKWYVMTGDSDQLGSLVAGFGGTCCPRLAIPVTPRVWLLGVGGTTALGGL